MRIKEAAAIVLALLAASSTTLVRAQGLMPQPLQVGCDWFLAYGPGSATGNTAFPEANAHYWLAVISESVPAGSRLEIKGNYPSARYSAFHVHNGNLEVMDSVADFVIQPDVAGSNPFTAVTRFNAAVPAGGAYAAKLLFQASVPATRQPNTLYRPAPGMLDGTTKKRTVLSYRTYLKNVPLDSSATLPRLTLVTPTATTALSASPDVAACASLRASYAQNGAALSGSANLVDATPPAMRPAFKKYAGAVYGAAGAVLPTQTGTVGYNPQNGFLYVKTSTLLGQLLLVRGKAPSYTTQPLGPVDSQVRYWSLCQYGFNSQKVVGCTADRGAKLDAQGYYTIVISPDAAAPSGATAANGITWMPWGPETLGDVILRYLLENPSFPQSIFNVPAMQDPATTMGVYAPKATYCSRAVFTASAGDGAANVFAACAASRL